MKTVINRTWNAACKHSKRMLLVALTIFLCVTDLNAEKKVLVVSSIKSMNLNSASSQWCWQRSRQTSDFVVFWEKDFGADPVKSAKHSVDVDALLATAEKAYAMYRDSLGFVVKGTSHTDSLKMIIFLYYTDTWMAYGSGEDEMIGTLQVNYAAASKDETSTVAHEVGHCFQYQVQCDKNNPKSGYNWGYGSAGSGGNGWWEQCAQWQAYRTFPEQALSSYYYYSYLTLSHKNFLHEDVRYPNYFTQYMWTLKNGKDFIGRLWRESKYPEDPVETYKRMTGEDQTQFCSDMYEGCARLATWDFPELRPYCATASPRNQASMTKTDSAYWRIDASNCVENYGYNVINLNVPTKSNTVKVCFEGLVPDGTTYRKINANKAGWRYGIVAMTADSVRHYSEMHSASYQQLRDTLLFDCPQNCKSLMLVVMGAPSAHWRHAWDDNKANDEQWPYQVKFKGTSLYGEFEEGSGAPHDTVVVTEVSVVASSNEGSQYVYPNQMPLVNAFCASIKDIMAEAGKNIPLVGIDSISGNYNVQPTFASRGFFYRSDGVPCSSDDPQASVFTYLVGGSLSFLIGGTSNAPVGKHIYCSQSLIDTIAGKPYRATLVFGITFVAPTSVETVAQSNEPFTFSWAGGVLQLPRTFHSVSVRSLGGVLLTKATESKSVDLSSLPSGIYLIAADGHVCKVVKR
jgi:hypothetical protein